MERKIVLMLALIAGLCCAIPAYADTPCESLNNNEDFGPGEGYANGLYWRCNSSVCTIDKMNDKKEDGQKHQHLVCTCEKTGSGWNCSKWCPTNSSNLDEIHSWCEPCEGPDCYKTDPCIPCSKSVLGNCCDEVAPGQFCARVCAQQANPLPGEAMVCQASTGQCKRKFNGRVCGDQYTCFCPTHSGGAGSSACNPQACEGSAPPADLSCPAGQQPTCSEMPCYCTNCGNAEKQGSHWTCQPIGNITPTPGGTPGTPTGPLDPEPGRVVLRPMNLAVPPTPTATPVAAPPPG